MRAYGRPHPPLGIVLVALTSASTQFRAAGARGRSALDDTGVRADNGRMPTIEAATRIEAPPDVVTGVLLDAGLAPEWTAGLERLELVDGVPGEAGCVGLAHYRQGGRTYTLVDVLEESVPGESYRSHILGGGIAATVETTLAAVGEGATVISIRWIGRGTNPLTRMTLPLMKRRIARAAAEDLASLRRLVEQV